MISTSIIGLIALSIGVMQLCVYVVSILRKQTKPHLFTWLVWTLLSGIAFLAQLHDHAGPGSWAVGMDAFGCLLIAVLCLKYRDREITKSDWIALIASLSAVIPWILTKDPLYSVILISIIDVAAFYPTFRKSWFRPHEESLMTYIISGTKMLLSLFALENFTVTTSLFMIVMISTNIIFVTMCYLRRKSMGLLRSSKNWNPS